jgi:hypothetical protein
LAPSSPRLADAGWRRIVGDNKLKQLAALGALLTLLLVKQAAKVFGRDSFNTDARHTGEDDVRRVVTAYLEDQISLEELDTWLTERTWDDAGAPALAYRVELLIAEYSRGDRDDLVEELNSLAAGQISRYPDGNGQPQEEGRTTAEPERA